MRPRVWLGGALALLFGVLAGQLIWPDAPLGPAPERRVDAAPSLREPVRFQLRDQHGRTVTAQDLRGQVVLVFFGYTFCPDVCPTTLFEMQQVAAGLGDDAARFRAVFITVDPQRDTQARLRDYLAHFGGELIGLRGSAEALAAAARSFGAVYERGQTLADGGYLMGHTAFGHLLDTGGRLHTLFPTGATAQDMIAAVRRLLAAGA